MRPTSLLRLDGIPRGLLRATVTASVLATLVALYQGWPGWAIVAAAVLPWFPVLGAETAWLSRHYGWFALFYLLTVTQTGHYIEHVAQMVQIHAFDRLGTDAHGVVGVLDVEAVHFGWNTAVFVAFVALLFKFRRNAWLWIGAIAAAWHQVEHTYTFALYLARGHLNPGLLDIGGAIGGGLPIMGPDLHFIYNTLETAPLIAAFLYQLRRTHDSWIERALPSLDVQSLRRLTAAGRPRRFSSGEVIVERGESSTACYVVVRGRLRAGDSSVGPGQVVGETVLLDAPVRTASITAETAGELIELDAATFREVLDESPEVAEELRQLALGRAAPR